MPLRARISVALLTISWALFSTHPALAADPTLHLEALYDQKLPIQALSHWGDDRMLDGMGWKIATAVRGTDEGGLKSYARRGYTVITPQLGPPVPLRHTYVLGAFDVVQNPNQELLVMVRDKELYWPDYDYASPPPEDGVELVWFNRDWKELFHLLLKFKATDFPDDWRVSKDGKYLLTILHPLKDGTDDKLRLEGDALKDVYIKDGEIGDMPFPEQKDGVAPADWWPVLMQWNRAGDLLVQAGEQARRYSVH